MASHTRGVQTEGSDFVLGARDAPSSRLYLSHDLTELGWHTTATDIALIAVAYLVGVFVLIQLTKGQQPASLKYVTSRLIYFFLLFLGCSSKILKRSYDA